MAAKELDRSSPLKSEISPDDLTSDVFARLLGNDVPKDTLEKQGITTSRQANTRRVASYLKTVADKMDQDEDLDGLIDQLRLDETTVYDTFKIVASEIFRSGITWGRVAVLFIFGAKVALKYFTNTGQLFNSLVSWVAKYITEKLMEWITAGGGWEAVGTFLMERFTDALTSEDTDSPDGRGLVLNISNMKWLVVGIGIGIAVAGWAFSQKGN